MQLPNQKEWGAGLGGIIAFGIVLGFSLTGHPLDPSIEGGLIVLVPAIIAKVVPASDQDILHRVNDTIVQAGTLLGKLTPASDSTVPPTIAAVKLAQKVS